MRGGAGGIMPPAGAWGGAPKALRRSVSKQATRQPKRAGAASVDTRSGSGSTIRGVHGFKPATSIVAEGTSRALSDCR